MATITIKNIPDDLYEKLKRSAELNRRSINSEVIVHIERSVSSHRIDPQQLLARARNLRELTIDHPTSDDQFSQMKAAGRP